MNVPRALARGKSVRVSAAGGPASARSQASTPGSGGTRRLLGAAEHSAGAADGPGPNAAAGDTQLEVPGCCAIRWAPVQRAAERLTTHPDFQLVVMLVILLNCVGGLWAGGEWGPAARELPGRKMLQSTLHARCPWLQQPTVMLSPACLPNACMQHWQCSARPCPRTAPGTARSRTLVSRQRPAVVVQCSSNSKLSLPGASWFARIVLRRFPALCTSRLSFCCEAAHHPLLLFLPVAAADIAVSVLFAVEMCLMVVAAGGPIEYLRWACGMARGRAGGGCTAAPPHQPTSAPFCSANRGPNTRSSPSALAGDPGTCSTS